MSTELVLLAVLMAAATYPSRALPLLVPRMDRLPHLGLAYLRLVGPAILAALAAVNVMVVTEDAQRTFHVGIEWLAVVLTIGIVAWRKNLFLGLVLAIFLVAGARAAELAW